MSSTTKWDAGTRLSGVTKASLLVITRVATGVGAATGLMLENVVEPLAIAVLAGLVGTLAAGLVRNTPLIRAWGAAGIEDVGTPALVLCNR
jgi:hypothetical protein